MGSWHRAVPGSLSLMLRGVRVRRAGKRSVCQRVAMRAFGLFQEHAVVQVPTGDGYGGDFEGFEGGCGNTGRREHRQ